MIPILTVVITTSRQLALRREWAESTWPRHWAPTTPGMISPVLQGGSSPAGPRGLCLASLPPALLLLCSVAPLWPPLAGLAAQMDHQGAELSILRV